MGMKCVPGVSKKREYERSVKGMRNDQCEGEGRRESLKKHNYKTSYSRYTNTAKQIDG